MDELRVEWPSGAVERLEGLAVERLYVVEEGKGIVEERELR